MKKVVLVNEGKTKRRSKARLYMTEVENGTLCPPVYDKDIDQQLLASDMEADDENAF
jgi:hypothetical protein